MARDIHQIRIESILGGISPYENYSETGQYNSAIGIDPSMFSFNSTNIYNSPSGYIVYGVRDTVYYTDAGLSGVPQWIVTTPKNKNVYVYDSVGSIYTVEYSGVTHPYVVTGLGDVNDGGSSHGNGCAYYDNYVYFAKDTTIARYGPLDGTPVFTDDYWVSTLGKAALHLDDNGYPGALRNAEHFLHKHGDKLYIADVVGNQGVLHYICTKKTTVEGDTDNGSTYNAIDFPTGMWPTSIASYGEDLAISLYEGMSTASGNPQKAKIAFWDVTNPDNYYKRTETEFPDTVITSMINSNGILYTFSGDPLPANESFNRICRFVGGYSFEQVAYQTYAKMPSPGTLNSYLNQIIYGSDNGKLSLGSVYSIGSKLNQISNDIHSIAGDNVITRVYSCNYAQFTDGPGRALIVGGKYNLTNCVHIFVSPRKDKNGSLIILPGSVGTQFTSQVYRIGSRFKVTKISFSLTTKPSTVPNITISPYILVDENITTYTLNTINNTSYGDETHVVLRPINCTGVNSFKLRFKFSGDTTGEIIGIALPITIEYELLDD